MGAGWLDAQGINGSISAYMTRVGFVFVVDYPPRDEGGRPGFEVFVPSDTANSSAVTCAALERLLAGGEPWSAKTEAQRAKVAEAAEGMATAMSTELRQVWRRNFDARLAELVGVHGQITAGVVAGVAEGLDEARAALDVQDEAGRMVALARALDKINAAIT